MVDDKKVNNSGLVDGSVELDFLSGADWVLDKGVSVRDLVLSRLPVDGFEAYCGEGWVPPRYRGDWGRVVKDLVVVCGALRGGLGREHAFSVAGVGGRMLTGWVRHLEKELNGCPSGFSTFLIDFFDVVCFVEGLVEESLSGVLLERALKENDRHSATYLMDRNNKEKKKKVRIIFEVLSNERDELKKLAENQGLTLSDFIKYCINYTVDKEGLMDAIEND